MKLLKEAISMVLAGLGYSIRRTSTYNTGIMSEFRTIPIRSILDIGAADGDTAASFLNAYKDAHVYAFEPLPEPFRDLSQMTQRFSDRLSAYNIALGDSETELEMKRHVDHSPSSSLLTTTALSNEMYPEGTVQENIKVRTTTLDAWFASQSPQPQLELLVKMDCQGYEDRIICGGKNTLRQAKVCIIEVLFKDLYEKQASFKEIFTLMDEIGFRYHGNFEQGVNNRGLVYADVLFVK